MLLWWMAVVAACQVAASLDATNQKDLQVTNKMNKYFSNSNCQCDVKFCSCCVHIDSNTPTTKACVNIAFTDYNNAGNEKKSVQVNLAVNGRIYETRAFSDLIENPPPICIPVPFAGIDFCVKLYDIQLAGTENTVCLQVMIKILGNELVTFDLQCLHLNNGVISLGP